jgi:Ran GTPase-activating protein (RanGAP) involved in mRNA processing and transport
MGDEMKLEPDLQAALEKLASSNRGVGFLASAKIAMRLFQLGLARPVKDHEERNVCAVTLDGFRFLETKRVEAGK